jgi:hypothetical protein
LIHDIEQSGGHVHHVRETPEWVPDWIENNFYVKVTRVSFWSPELDDKALGRLSRQMTDVLDLELFGTSVTDDGFGSTTPSTPSSG